MKVKPRSQEISRYIYLKYEQKCWTFFLNWVKGKSGLYAWKSLYTISFISSLNIKTNCRTLVDKQEYIKALSALDSFRLLNIEIRDRCNITRLCWVHVVKPVTVELGPFSICLCNMSVFLFCFSNTQNSADWRGSLSHNLAVSGCIYGAWHSQFPVFLTVQPAISTITDLWYLSSISGWFVAQLLRHQVVIDKNGNPVKSKSRCV